MFEIVASRASVRRLHVGAGPARDVVHDDRQRRAVGNGTVVLIQPFLCRPVVVRRDRKEPVGARATHALGEMHDLLRVVAAGARQHGHFARGFVDQNLDAADAFLVAERRILAGRPARAQEVNAGVDLAPPEAPHALFVELARRGERRDERGSDAGEICPHGCTPSTSCIVNQPRLPLNPLAAMSAPRAKALRSRAVCESVIDSAGPSKPIVCTPGM